MNCGEGGCRKNRREILLHSCCAVCTIFPEKRLAEDGWEITGFFYNPNIHPFTEFERRLFAVRDYYRNIATPLVIDAHYDVLEYLKTVTVNERRCERCYRLRLFDSAKRARSLGITVFSTTLLFSVHQDHDAIREIGAEAAREHGVDFYYEDFRKGWEEGTRASRDRGIYRQKYCGCIASEEERFKKRIERLQNHLMPSEETGEKRARAIGILTSRAERRSS